MHLSAPQQPEDQQHLAQVGSLGMDGQILDFPISTEDEKKKEGEDEAKETLDEHTGRG